MILSFLLAINLMGMSQDPPAKQAPANAVQKSDIPQTNLRLLQVRRMCVESLGSDPLSRQVQAMLINALVESKRFTITEKCEKADAVLKGVATEESHQEAHSSSESTAVGNARANSAIADSSHSTETINDSHVAVRLVDQESGDVIWSTTKESSGAKYKSSRADAADQTVNQLLWDIDKLERLQKEQAGPSTKKPPSPR